MVCKGRRLLLVAEQGLGDTLHFAGLARMLARDGAAVWAQVQPALVRVLQGVPGLAGVVSTADPAPPVDLWCPMLSLGLHLGKLLL